MRECVWVGGGVKYGSTHFCFAIEGGVWSASFPSRFSSGDMVPENTLKKRELVYS